MECKYFQRKYFGIKISQQFAAQALSGAQVKKISFEYIAFNVPEFIEITAFLSTHELLCKNNVFVST